MLNHGPYSDRWLKQTGDPPRYFRWTPVLAKRDDLVEVPEKEVLAAKGLEPQTGAPATASETTFVEQGMESSAREEAKTFLRNLLDYGPVPSTEVWKKANQATIAERTLKRAKQSLGVKSVKEGREGWIWRLPE